MTRGLHKPSLQILHGNWRIQTASLASDAWFQLCVHQQKVYYTPPETRTHYNAICQKVSSYQNKENCIYVWYKQTSVRINIYLFFLALFSHLTEFQMITKQYNLTTEHLLSPYAICEKLHHVRTTKKRIYVLCTINTKQNKSLPVFPCTNSSDFQIDPAVVTIW